MCDLRMRSPNVISEWLFVGSTVFGFRIRIFYSRDLYPRTHDHRWIYSCRASETLTTVRLTSTSNSILTSSSLCRSSTFLDFDHSCRATSTIFLSGQLTSITPLDLALSSSSFFCHNRLPSMTTLTFCIISVIAIFPTISPFGIDGNMSLFLPL